MSTSVSKALAYHEAGHAVVCVVLGLGLEHVEVTTGRLKVGELGGCVLRDDKSGGVDREVLIALAGPVAEAIVRKKALVKVSAGGTCQDYFDAWDSILDASGDEHSDVSDAKLAWFNLLERRAS